MVNHEFQWHEEQILIFNFELNKTLKPFRLVYSIILSKKKKLEDSDLISFGIRTFTMKR